MKRLLLILPLLLVPFFGTSQPIEKACFSVPGGFYEESPTLEIFPFYQQHHIRFTTNGNRPTAQSRLYTEPLLLDGSLYSTSDIYTIPMSPEHLVYVPDSVQHCIVIRAAVFDENDNCISEVVTNSYFIHSLGCDTHGLPVMSLCADSLDLFGYDNGILVPGAYFDPSIPSWTGNYYQHGMPWERCCNWEFYELDNSGVNQQIGLRTHGGTGRRGPQKALKIYAREEYGTQRFHHRFFEAIPNDSFKHLVLKPFSCEWFSTGIQDEICQKMAKHLNVESLETRPTVLFLNGEYWGIYYLCERPDAHYLEDHFGHPDEEYNVVGDWKGENENGDNSGFLNMMQWLETADLSDARNYDHLCSIIDLNCFIDYYCFELFIANNDWPANNMRCYQRFDGPWRWIFYDGDDALMKMSFDVFANATYVGDATWPSSNESTLMFRKLLENSEFRDAFLQRFNQLMAGEFDYEQTESYFLDAAEKVRMEVPQQAARFNKPHDLDHWEYLIHQSDVFLQNRVNDMRQRLAEFMYVPEYPTSSLTLFPNPFQDQITLWIDAEQQENVSCQVYDIQGRQMATQNLSLHPGHNRVILNLSFPSGLYLLKINGIVNKIVKQ